MLAEVLLLQMTAVGIVPGVAPKHAAILVRVPAIAVVEEDVDFVVAVVEAESGIISADEGDVPVLIHESHCTASLHHGVEPRLFLLLEDNVEDAGHAIGFEPCRWIGDNLHAFNHVGGNLVKGKVCRTPVH